MKNEFRFEAIENAGKLITIHFDMDGADGRACRQDAEIAEQLLDGIVGKKRNPVVRPNAALRQERGETAAAFAQAGVIDLRAHHSRRSPTACAARAAAARAIQLCKSFEPDSACMIECQRIIP